MELPFVITIVGPESSGKTTLAKHLAEAIGCVWIPEYARVYLEELGRPYGFEDLEIIARGQMDLFQATLDSQQFSMPSLPAASLNNVVQGLMKPDLTQADLIFQLNGIRDGCLIVDSGLLSIRMWARIKFARTIDFVEESLKNDVTSLYLLTRAQKAWEPDPLREAPKLVDRVWIYNQYLSELSNTGLLFKIH